MKMPPKKIFSAALRGGGRGWLSRWLPIVMAIGGVAATLAFSHRIKVHQNDNIRHSILSEAEAVSRSIQSIVTANVESLVLMTRRWEIREPSASKWEADTRMELAHAHGFEVIERLDASLQPQWSVHSGGKKSIDTESAFGEPRETALQQSRERRAPVVTQAIDLPGGGMGVVIYVPIFVGPNAESFDGFISAMLNLHSSISESLDVNLWRKYDLEVVEGVKHIYTRPGTQDETKRDWAQATDLKFYGIDWRSPLWKVRLWPTPDWLNEIDNSIDQAVLVSGLTLTGLLALLTHFFGLARSRTTQLQIANSALTQEIDKRMKAQTALADFTAMIVHDVRSPLSNVISIATMMKDGLFGPVNADQTKWLNKVDQAGRSAVDLISDFLDVSRVEAGRIDLVTESMDLRQLLELSIETYSPAAQEKGILLKVSPVDSLPQVDADPRRLQQVMNNLISNSLKFTPRGGEIVVGAGWNEKEIEVFVRDTGVGIPADEIGGIFQKYKQTSSGATSKQKGTGLGLVICKMILEAHGGTIRAESQAEKGTTFKFTLPRNRFSSSQNTQEETMNRQVCKKALAAAAALALMIGVLPLSARAAEKPAHNLERVRIVYAGLSGNQAPGWAAHDGGFFRKQGLDVELVNIVGGATSVKSLLSGDVPFAQVSGLPTLESSLQGSGIVIIAGLLNTMNYQFIVGKEIKRPDQLKGKTVAVSRNGSSSDFASRYALDRFGLVPGKDVTLVEIGNQPDRLAALATGKIQGVMLEVPMTLKAKKMGFPVLIDLQMLGLEYQATVLATTQATIKSRPDLVRKVLTAYVEGIHYFKTNRNEALRILRRHLKTDDAEALRETYEGIGLALIPEKPYPTMRGIQTILRELSETNPKAQTARAEQFVNTTFLKELDSSGFIDRLYKASPVAPPAGKDSTS